MRKVVTDSSKSSRRDKRLLNHLFAVVIAMLIQWATANAQGIREFDTEERDAELISAFLEEHCVACHGPREQHSGIRLDRHDLIIDDHSRLTHWQDVLDVLNTGAMPPKDQEQPSKEDLTTVIGLVTNNISSARRRLAATGGVIKMRHLTKREYVGSMNDLFGGEVPSDILPDDPGNGFDTNGSQQFFSLKQYENYNKAGRTLVQRNIQLLASTPPKPSSLRHDPEAEPFEQAKTQYLQMVKVMELINAGAPPAKIAEVDPRVADLGQVRLFKQRFRRDIVKPRARYNSLKGKSGLRGAFAYTVNVRPRSLYWLTLHTEEAGSEEFRIRVNDRAIGAVKLVAGDPQSSQVGIRTELFDTKITIHVEGTEQDVVDYVTLIGPYEDEQRVPAFFENIVGPIVRERDVSDEQIRGVLCRFADRAFRRQGVDGEYITELVKVFRLEQSVGKSVAEALIEPLTSILSSPAFLYLKEHNDGSRKVIGQLEFAIRMAYFLWGSPPDDQLYALAMADRLYDHNVLKAQYERMLASPKADVFLTDFINQWAEIRRFDEIDLPVGLIRSGFQASARQELSEFFKVLVRENRSLDHLINSDFVVVDQRLAQYYGLRIPIRDGFRKVRLPKASTRGGMLTQAAFLIAGGAGQRTSPTIRGAIIRDKFLHDPVPPPPPNIPVIENEKGQELTVKQLVDRHKDVAQCASCHDRIDPIGYGLENFDYLGKWRTSETISEAAGVRAQERDAKDQSSHSREIAIDASGNIEGERFDNLHGLRTVLASHRGQLARSVYESLLSYGIGRKIEFIDEPDVRANLSELEKLNYPLKQMIFQVITSRTFATK